MKYNVISQMRASYSLSTAHLNSQIYHFPKKLLKTQLWNQQQKMRRPYLSLPIFDIFWFLKTRLFFDVKFFKFLNRLPQLIGIAEEKYIFTLIMSAFRHPDKNKPFGHQIAAKSLAENRYLFCVTRLLASIYFLI